MNVVTDLTKLSKGQQVALVDGTGCSEGLIAVGVVQHVNKVSVRVVLDGNALTNPRVVDFRNFKWRGIRPHNENGVYSCAELRVFGAEDDVDALIADLKQRNAEAAAKAKAKADAQQAEADKKAQDRANKIAAFWEYAGRELWEEKRQVVQTVVGQMLVISAFDQNRNENTTYFVKAWQELDPYDWDFKAENREQRKRWTAVVTSIRPYVSCTGERGAQGASHSTLYANTIQELVFDLIH